MRGPNLFAAAAERLNRRTLRERLLIAAAVLALLCGLWDRLLMRPVQQQRAGLLTELNELQNEMAANAQATELAHAGEAVAQAQALARDRAALQAVDRKLYSKAAGLLRPSQMAQVVGDLLARRQGLKLQLLSNEPARALLDTAGAADPAPAQLGPYVHTMNLEFEGSYLELLGFLQSLERLPWRFYWTGLELRTLNYPTNRVRLQLSTLSMDTAWLNIG